MKLFCFTITFFLVNVLANIETDYKWIVVKTNTAIELAYNKNDLTVGENSQANGLEYVIEKILEHVDFREKSFADINLMFAVPDKTELNNMGNGCLRLPIVELYEWSALFDIQFNLQRVIRSRLGIAIPEPEAGQDFGSLNLTTLAEQRRHYVELALKNIFKREFGSMYDQFIYQLEIRDTINVRGLNVTTLVENRKVTGTSLENVITRVLETGAPESNEAVENQRSHENDLWNSDFVISEYCQSLLRLGCLMGLYMSTKFPTTCIKKLWVNTINNTCYLDDGNLIRRLKQINGVWWQISSQKRLL